MRKIKSAPANISEMSHSKKPYTVNETPTINKTYTIIKTKFINNSNKIKNILNPGLASDFITENFNSISHEIGYNENMFIEFVNNFVNKKLNIKNLEIFILSLMVRYVINHAYHDLLIKIKEFIMIN